MSAAWLAMLQLNENRLQHKKELVWVQCEMIQERQKRTAIKMSANRKKGSALLVL